MWIILTPPARQITLIKMNPLPRTRVEEILAAAKGKKILVIGDVMLDRSIYTTSTRMSPECADVPVLDVQETKEYHGGANNTAVNCQSLGAIVTVLTVMPKDMKNNVDGVTSYSASCATCEYTVKERVFKDGKQVFRMDSGNMKDAGAKVRDMVDSIRCLVKDMDAVIISDYNKGVITQEVFDCVAQECKQHGKWIGVNAKPANPVCIHNVDLITLNRSEAGEYAPANQFKELISLPELSNKIHTVKISFALVTLGGDGAMLQYPTADSYSDIADGIGISYSCPSFCKKFVDGCGAGDTVIAAYTVAIQGGASPEEAMVFASMVAAVSVSKVGTASVTPDELHNYFNPPLTDGEWKDLLDGKNPKTVFANGCYDNLHVGHIAQLTAAKALGEKLVVAINSDQRIRELKGATRPLVKEADRKYHLEALRCVDEVRIFTEDTSAAAILDVKPDIYVKGAEYTPDTIPPEERAACEQVGAKMVFVSPRPEIRTGQFEEAPKPKNKAVFLDRDGTIIVDWIDQHEPEKVKLLHNAGEGLQKLRDAGYLLFVVTNQSGINRGVFTVEQMMSVNLETSSLLEGQYGVQIKCFFYAPERNDEPSDYRKPSPRALLDAARDFKIDLSQSYFIGDKITDLQCGWNAFVKKCYLVMTGFGTHTLELIKNDKVPVRTSYGLSLDLLEAANHILEDK